LWRALSALFVDGFVTFGTLYCTQPLMPVFSEEFGVSPAVISLGVVSLLFYYVGSTS